MSKSIYERVINLRNRISLDGDDTIYEEDYLLLDEVLDFISSVEQQNEIETQQRLQEEDYNATVDIYKELEIGAEFKRQKKLLELYKKLLPLSTKIERLVVMRSDYNFSNEEDLNLNEMIKEQKMIQKQIKELENEQR